MFVGASRVLMDDSPSRAAHPRRLRVRRGERPGQNAREDGRGFFDVHGHDHVHEGYGIRDANTTNIYGAGGMVTTINGYCVSGGAFAKNPSSSSRRNGSS